MGVRSVRGNHYDGHAVDGQTFGEKGRLVITITSWLRSQLIEFPEYGMGYQYGSALLSTGNWEKGYILNSSTFIKEGELKGMSARDMALAERDAQTTRLSIVRIELISRPPETLRGVRRIRRFPVTNSQKQASLRAFSEELAKSLGAKDAPVTTTEYGDLFKRFSAYVNDFRITQKKGLTAGTFATTAEDAENVRTGREAVARYALENKASANKRFTISPAGETKVREGVVQPAYGEPGGGIEVIFVDGTGDNTVSGPEILPEE
jgi:hypothetical protein